RCDHRSAVDKWRCIGGMNEATPRALAHKWSKSPSLEHVGHQVATGAGHFIDDHHLRSPDASRRTGKRESISGDVVEINIKVELQNIDDVIGSRSTTIEPLVYDHAFLVLLRKIVAIEAGV